MRISSPFNAILKLTRHLLCASVIALSLLSAGCSSLGLDSPGLDSSTPIEAWHKIDGLLLSYNRSTLGHTDFEQYRLVEDQLVWECGRISAGRYNPATQKVTSVPSDTLETIRDLSAQIHRLVSERGAKFETPGTTPEFFDPGQFTLTLEQSGASVEIKTTFDSVAIPNANREKLLNQLTLAVRGVVADEPPCGIKEFYHLSKPRGFSGN